MSLWMTRDLGVRPVLGLALALVVPAVVYLTLRDVDAPAAAPPPVLATAEAEQDARRLALQVRTVTCAGSEVGSGFATGVTTLVTNRHVVDGASSVRFVRDDGLILPAGATAAAFTADLAVVTLDRPIPEVVTLAERDARPGDAVLVAGFPRGGPLQVSRGAVVDTAVDPTGGPVLRLTAAVAPGSSGSPVFDERGHLVGVIYALQMDTGYALAIPVSALRATLADPPAAVSPATC